MDLGEGMNKECYMSMQSFGRDISFTDLFNMVANGAELSNFTADGSVQVNKDMVVGSADEIVTEKSIEDTENRILASMEEGICDRNMKFSTDNYTQPEAEINKRGLEFGSELPDESIGTSCFAGTSFNCGESNCSDGISKASVSRTISNFQLEEDCAATDVTSQVREFNGGIIEESMRKYVDDKKRVMFEPEVGMEFTCTEEAFHFYNMYSWVLGFSIRLGDNYTTKTKQRTMQEYLCQRQGNGDETKHSTTRCGCKAMMRVATNDSSKCTQRSESANHVLKVYVPCKSSINMFVKQYTKLIDDREKADDEAEKNKSQKTSKTMFGYPIEKHASKLYTMFGGTGLCMLCRST